MIRKGNAREESCEGPLWKWRGAGGDLPSRTGERQGSARSKVRAKTEGQMCVLPGTAKGICVLPEVLLLTSSTGKLFRACVIPVLRESVFGYVKSCWCREDMVAES